MKRKGLKFISLGLVVFSCFSFFIACSPFKELSKVSKNLTKYIINAMLNDNMTIDAEQTVKFVNSTNVILDHVCFNMFGTAFSEEATIKPYTKLNQGKCFPDGESFGDMNVYDVKVDGKNAIYTLTGEDRNAISVQLSKNIEPGQSVNISFKFFLKLANCTHRLGYFKGKVNLGNWFPILAMYEKGEFLTYPYYSAGDPFYSDIANYEINFTYPNQYKLCSSGVIKGEEIQEQTKTNKISALAVRDFAITLTENSQSKSGKYKDTTVEYVGYGEDLDIDYCLNVSLKAIEFFSKKFGAYVYPSLNVVKAPFLHGGMEYPSLVIISDNITDKFELTKVIVHEIAHQWWYAMVGNNQVTEAWLDESLAEYSSLLFFENFPEFDVSYKELVSDCFESYTLYADIVNTLEGDIKTSMLLKANEYNSDYEYAYMIYVKGVLMFDSLRQAVGKQKLETGLKKYFSKYKFKIATTDCFIECMRKGTNRDIEGFFDSWLNGKTLIGTI